jgi:hypothetical protein
MDSQAMQPTINVAGTILNMKNSGFDHSNRLCELIDNSISAGAKRVRFIVNRKTHILTYIDDACGMDSQGLFDYGTLNKRATATNTSHGCYGIGGKHALSGFTDNNKAHIISKPINKTGIFEMKINYDDAIRTNIYSLVPHEASRTSENKWDEYAFDKDGNGTVQLMYSNPSVVNELSCRISTDDITKDSIRFELGCIYNKYIRKSLLLELVIDDKIYVVYAFDRLMFEKIQAKYRQEVVVTAYKYPTGGYRFYFKDAAGVSQYRDCSASKKGKMMKDSPPLIISASRIIKVGDISIKSTYSNEWKTHQTPDLLKMGFKNKDSSGINVYEKDILGGIVYERNEKQISHFPSKPSIHVTGTKQKYINESHHLIEFKACDEMDDLFKVQLNKSKLIEENIHKDLFGTIAHLCDNFADNIKKIVETSTVATVTNQLMHVPAPTPLNVVPSVEKTNIIPISTASVATPAPATMIPKPKAALVKSVSHHSTKAKTENIKLHSAPINPAKPEGQMVAKAPVTQAPVTQAPVTQATGVNEPKTPIAPILRPALNVVFSKTDTHMLVNHSNEIKARIPYTGQYNITEKYYNEIITKLGEERFLEWIIGRSKLVNDYDSKYFS